MHRIMNNHTLPPHVRGLARAEANDYILRGRLIHAEKLVGEEALAPEVLEISKSIYRDILENPRHPENQKLILRALTNPSMPLELRELALKKVLALAKTNETARHQILRALEEIADLDPLQRRALMILKSP